MIHMYSYGCLSGFGIDVIVVIWSAGDMREEQKHRQTEPEEEEQQHYTWKTRYTQRVPKCDTINKCN